MNSQISKLSLRDRLFLENRKLQNDPKRKQRVMIKLQELAKAAGIRGYSSLSQEDLMAAIEVEAKYKTKILSEFNALKEQLRLEKDKEEKRSFIDELGRL